MSGNPDQGPQEGRAVVLVIVELFEVFVLIELSADKNTTRSEPDRHTPVTLAAFVLISFAPDTPCFSLPPSCSGETMCALC